MTDKKQWIIITSGDQSLQDVSRALKKTGFTIDDTLEAIGQIIGTGTDKMKNEALTIKGVADIIPSQDNIDIGPPGSNITW